MKFFGKKGDKGKRGQAQQQGRPVGEFNFDPSAPDAFSEENLAKMSGVDTMTFDENDPTLMAELAEIGWEDEGHPSGAGGVASVPKGHRDPSPAVGNERRKAKRREEDVSEAPSRQQGGNELLRSLGMSLNSMGDTELTEQDLQDPDLLKELEEVSGGVDLGGDESNEKPLPRKSSKSRPESSDADDQLTEQDLQDPDLLKELEEVSGGVDFGDNGSKEKPLPRRSSKTRAKHSDADRQDYDKPVGPDPKNYDIPQEAESMMSEEALDEALGSMLEGDDAAGEKKSLRPAAAAGFPPRKPSRRASSRTSGGSGDNVAREIAQLEKESNRLQQRAKGLKKAGDREGAIATMRDRGALEQELQVLRTLATTQKVATVTTEYVDAPGPSTPSSASAVSGDVGDGSSTTMSAERAMEEVTRLYERAVKLKKKNRMAEASDCKRQAKALEADLERRGVVKARIASGEDTAVIEAEGRRPSSMPQVDAPNPSTPSSAAADPNATGSGNKPMSTETIMAKVTLLYQRAVELKKENRMTEAMNCMKRAKNFEADLVSKGLIAPGEDMSHVGLDGRRPSFSRQGSYTSRSSRRSIKGGDAGTAAADGRDGRDGDGLRGRRSGSQKTELPDSVKATIRPKAFPAERDLFSDLEDALAAAIQIHKERARAVVKKDRAAAAREVKRYNELQGKLDLTREMRVVPGARPPAWQWKIVKKSRIRVLDHVAKDQMELEIMRVHGLTDKTDNKGSMWIKYDLGYSKDEKIGKGVTQGYRCEHDTVDVGFKALSFVKRARSMQMACQNRRAVFEIMHKSSIFSREKPIGKCLVPLQPLLAQCELAVSSPILTEGRREAGGSIELALRLRKPIASDELIVTEEKELEVGEWPPVSSEPLPVSTPTRTVAQAAAAASAAPSASASAAPATAKASTRSSAMSAEFEDVKLTELEKSDPFAVENLDSNMLLESEIEKVQTKAATGDLAAVMRKGALETKLMMLVSAVQSGELDLPAYCKILRERIVRDKVLALHLKNENRKKEALAVLKRVRVMEEELAGVPEDQQGLEDEKEGVDGDS